MSKILLVDDDVELSTMLGEYLEQEGFGVGIRHDGEQGAAEALSGGYDMVVLDVMMPRLNGVEALRRIRAERDAGAHADRQGRRRGSHHRTGAGRRRLCPQALHAARTGRPHPRHPAPQRQRTAAASGVMVVGPLSLWPERRTAEWAGAQLELTSTEFNLLEVLARNAGRVVSKSDLSEQALGRPLTRFDRSIDVHMSSIRHKLGPRADGQSWIMTVRGMGYQLVRTEPVGRLFWKFFFAFWLSLLVAGAAVGTACGCTIRPIATRSVCCRAGRAPPGCSIPQARSSNRPGRRACADCSTGGSAVRGAASSWWSTAKAAICSVAACRPKRWPARAARAAHGAEEQVREVALPSGESYLLFVTSDGDAHPPRDRRPANPSDVADPHRPLPAWASARCWRGTCPNPCATCAGPCRPSPRASSIPGWSRSWGRRDEIADLGRDFDRMAQQLQQLMAAQRRLLHDVSHELRSPLARLQAAIGLFRQNPARPRHLPRAYRARVGAPSTNSWGIAHPVAPRGRRGDAPLESLDLMDLIAAIADDARFEAEANGRELNFEGQGEAVALVRGELMHRAFENVIRNAVSITAAGTCGR